MLDLLPRTFHISLTDQRRVAEDWLADEQRKESSKNLDIEASEERHAVEAKLLAHKPGAARPLLESTLSWSHCRLPETALRRVYTIWGPPDERETVETVARRIRAGESLPRVCNVGRIRALADDDHEDRGTLVIAHHRPPWKRGSPVLLDGNHRAVAAVLDAQTNGTYEPRHAYVGYSGPSKLSHLRRSLHAALDIL
jgi:hypothetical protein